MTTIESRLDTIEQYIRERGSILTRDIVVNFEIHYADGSTAQDSGAFNGFPSMMRRAGEWLESDSTIERIDIREVRNDWPIIVSVVAGERT